MERSQGEPLISVNRQNTAVKMDRNGREWKEAGLAKHCRDVADAAGRAEDLGCASIGSVLLVQVLRVGATSDDPQRMNHQKFLETSGCTMFCLCHSILDIFFTSCPHVGFVLVTIRFV